MPDDDPTPAQPFLRFFRLPAAAYEHVRASLDAYHGLTKEATSATGQIVKSDTSLPPVESATQDEDGNAYVCINAWHLQDEVVAQTVAGLIADGVAVEVTQEDYQALQPEPDTEE